MALIDDVAAARAARIAALISQPQAAAPAAAPDAPGGEGLPFASMEDLADIDRSDAATPYERMVVSSLATQRDKLRALERSYGAGNVMAVPGDDENFVFRAPDGKLRYYNRPGLDWRDLASILPDVAEGVGGALGALGGATLTAPTVAGTLPGAIAGAGAGAAGGRGLATSLIQGADDILGRGLSEDTRGLGEIALDSAKTAAINGALEPVAPLARAAWRGGRNAVSRVLVDARDPTKVMAESAFPYAGSASTMTEALAEAAQRQGVSDALSTGIVGGQSPRLLAATLQRGTMGQRMAQRVEEAVGAVDNGTLSAFATPARIGRNAGIPDGTEINQAVREGAAFVDGSSAAYQKGIEDTFIDHFGPDMVPTSGLSGALDTMLDTPQSAFGSAARMNRSVAGEQARALRESLNEPSRRIPGTGDAALGVPPETQMPAGDLLRQRQQLDFTGGNAFDFTQAGKIRGAVDSAFDEADIPIESLVLAPQRPSVQLRKAAAGQAAGLGADPSASLLNGGLSATAGERLVNLYDPSQAAWGGVKGIDPQAAENVVTNLGGHGGILDASGVKGVAAALLERQGAANGRFSAAQFFGRLANPKTSRGALDTALALLDAPIESKAAKVMPAVGDEEVGKAITRDRLSAEGLATARAAPLDFDASASPLARQLGDYALLSRGIGDFGRNVNTSNTAATSEVYGAIGKLARPWSWPGFARDLYLQNRLTKALSDPAGLPKLVARAKEMGAERGYAEMVRPPTLGEPSRASLLGRTVGRATPEMRRRGYRSKAEAARAAGAFDPVALTGRERLGSGAYRTLDVLRTATPRPQQGPREE